MTNLVYIARETPVIFQDTGAGPTLGLNNLAALAVKASDRHDFGAGSKPQKFSWRLTVQWKTGDEPAIGDAVYIYLATSDGSKADGGLGTSAALSDTDHLRNMRLIGVLGVTSTVAAHDMTASGVVEIDTRYVQVVVYNASDAGILNNSDDVSHVTLTSIPDEIQDAP